MLYIIIILLAYDAVVSSTVITLTSTYEKNISWIFSPNQTNSEEYKNNFFDKIDRAFKNKISKYDRSSSPDMKYDKISLKAQYIFFYEKISVFLPTLSVDQLQKGKISGPLTCNVYICKIYLDN